MDKKQIVLTVAVGVSMFAAGFLVRAAWDHAAVISSGGGTQDEYLTQGGQIDGQGQTLVQTPQGGQEQGVLTGDGKETGLVPEEIKVRIDDGEVQWFDGTLWHTVAAVEDLVAEDRFCKAEEAFLAFTEQLIQEKVQEQAQVSQEQDTLLQEEGPEVGQKPTPKPTPKPPKKPEQQEPAPDAEEPVETPPPSVPAAPPSTPTGPAPTPQPTPPPADTGDGEDMGWSDDYL